MEIFPSAQFEAPLPNVESLPVSREDALLALVTGWIAHGGPVTANQLGNLLTLLSRPREDFVAAGASASCCAAIHGPASDETNGAKADCSRASTADARNSERIQSVTPAQFMNWQLRWQHVAPARSFSATGHA